jgi:hypothetical protein
LTAVLVGKRVRDPRFELTPFDAIRHPPSF